MIDISEIEALHQPCSPPWHRRVWGYDFDVDWTYCGCGSYDIRMVGNRERLAPAEYPCKTIRLLRELVKPLYSHPDVTTCISGGSLTSTDDEKYYTINIETDRVQRSGPQHLYARRQSGIYPKVITTL